MSLGDLFRLLGPEIQDPEEGTDYTIHQSPTILNRPGSTTGAVIWKITPLVASWLSSPNNLLWKTGALLPSSSVLELGCGISGLVGLAVSPLVSRYVLTDQTYVARLVEKNLEENLIVQQKSAKKRKGKPSGGADGGSTNPTKICFKPLDWELDEVTPSLTGSSNTTSFDAVIACDCIYNETLIAPLVQTCADACGLRNRSSNNNNNEETQDTATTPVLCIVAQQLRDPEIFEGWIKEFNKHFRVWRVPEEMLSQELRANTGFVVHIGVLRDAAAH
ncbi:hypothetical protein NPX13_g10971 [Xylaria arbuscula]|uniref:Diaminohydroxyphosphoribosylamino-pyrimidine deaminase n=1 Tax=Xylaria arbuscula TaxID=114810 RepID=A0A9W8TGA8_9PEZI|nr:hypothetical protein NPX13_g10971 [Xylaria arbuscula]